MARQPAPPVDPDVKVPRAVREAAQRASAAQHASLGIAEPPVVPPEPPAQDPPPIAAPPAGNPSVPPVTPGVTPPPPPPPGAPPPAVGAAPSPAVPPTPPPQDPPPDEPVDWEHRYKTMAGRAEADRKRAKETVDQLVSRIGALEQQIAAAPTPAKPAPKLNVTQEEINDYGEDFLGLVRRVAEHVVDGKIQPITSELGRTRAQVGASQARTMHQQMDSLYPDWQRMNNDERFIAWVQLPDPYSGAIRQRLMQEAWDAGDAHRVNRFFQGFLAEDAAVNPVGGTGQPAAPAPAAPPNGTGAPAAVPPLTLAALAAPGSSRSAQPPPAEKPVYTTEDITRFYTEVAAGRWRHREQERAAIDADIMRAQHEGRITTGRRYVPPQPPSGMTR